MTNQLRKGVICVFQVGSIFIPVTNLEKSKPWYEENLGLILVDDWSGGAGYVFPSGTTGIALIEVNSYQPSEFVVTEENKNVYFNLTVDDISRAHQSFKRNKAETTEIKDGDTMTSFDVYDPDGNAISIICEKPDSLFHKNHIKNLQEIKF
ncbi:VOC family protein [Halobacillus sp. Marseille-Q1614]|uniref:VOC family protein n=1 Tax=Halobacillus sp. Marseille-Q1614 TaxID=2709134 RepID=UPI0020C4A27E|nr:VOC family protein [Halobacillus sp. Marseille-Q1614]